MEQSMKIAQALLRDWAKQSTAGLGLTSSSDLRGYRGSGFQVSDYATNQELCHPQCLART
jgi:hypothetical protein